jgi:MoxR-like ATPase
VLGHRLILRPESRLRKKTAASIIKEILDESRVPVPESQEEAEDAWR